MATSVEDLCQALATAFSRGDVDALSDHYVYPLVVYLPDGLRIDMSPEDTARAAFARRAAAVRAGMRRVRVRILDVAEMEGNRIPASLSWDFLDGGDRLIGSSRMRYFCRRSAEGRLRVEMIEVSTLAFASMGRPDLPVSPRHN